MTEQGGACGALDGYRVRRPVDDDLEAVTALVQTCERTDFGTDRAPDDVAVFWELLDRPRDTWVVESEGGELVATVVLRRSPPVQMLGYVAVHPRHRERGIGSHALTLLERRADEHAAVAAAGAEVTLHQSVGSLNPAAGELLVAGGYHFARRFWEMGVELEADVPEPSWPEGTAVETLTAGGEREVYDLMSEAFRDHWGFVESPYHEWRAVMVEREMFDPSLWFLVRDGDSLAGGALCRLQADGSGWISVLGVRPEHRRRGLGLALLGLSLRELRARGIGRAGLHVDSENVTGATRLYERAGMQVVRHSDTYGKVLRTAGG